MKFIKLFEELSPEVYINVGKLVSKNQKNQKSSYIKSFHYICI